MNRPPQWCCCLLVLLPALLLALAGPAASFAADPFRFDAARLFPAGDWPRNKVLEDLDGDGNLDLAVACYGGDEVAFMLGNGDGTFNPPSGFPTVSNPFDLVAGDLDNDGDIDLVISLYHLDVVQVLHNDGNAGFTTAGWFTTGERPIRMVLADLDGDKDLDLVVQISPAISVLLNNGDGSFAARTTYPAADKIPGALLAGDVTGDGLPDLLAGYRYDDFYYGQWGEVWVLPGLGDGTFVEGPVLTTTTGVTEMELADLDGDGLFDLVTLESSYDDYYGLISGNLKQYPGAG